MDTLLSKARLNNFSASSTVIFKYHNNHSSLILGSLIGRFGWESHSDQIKAYIRHLDCPPFLDPSPIWLGHLRAFWIPGVSLFRWRPLGTPRAGWFPFLAGSTRPKNALWSTLGFSGAFCVVAAASWFGRGITVFAGAVFTGSGFLLLFSMLFSFLWLEKGLC